MDPITKALFDALVVCNSALDLASVKLDKCISAQKEAQEAQRVWDAREAERLAAYHAWADHVLAPPAPDWCNELLAETES